MNTNETNTVKTLPPPPAEIIVPAELLRFEPVRGDHYRGLLRVGQSIRSILYNRGPGYITKIIGEQRPDTIRTIGGFITSGGVAEICVKWSTGGTSERVPESIVRGVQWYIGGMLAPAEIAEIDALNSEANQARKIEAERKEAERLRMLAELPLQFPHLETVEAFGKRTGKNGSYSDGILAAINIRTELKKAFPGVKFSVRVPHYGTVRISWADGPCYENVNSITKKYEDHQADESGDFWDPAPTVFTKLFGGGRFVMASRDFTDAAWRPVEQWAAERMASGLDRCFETSDTAGQIAYRLLHVSDIPRGYVVTGVQHRAEENHAHRYPACMWEITTSPAPQ